MSDINLLPIQERKREHDEEKNKTLAKSKSRIELTNPEEEKKKPKTKGLDLKLSAWWLKIKKTTHDVKNIFKSKSSARVKVDMQDKLNKSEAEEKPREKKEVVEHTKEFKPKTETKQFYYTQPEQSPPVSLAPKNEDKKNDEQIKKDVDILNVKVEQSKPEYIQAKKVEQKKGIKMTDVEKRKTQVEKININLISGQIALTKTGYRNVKILILASLVVVLILAGSYLGLKSVIKQKQLEFEQIETSLQNIDDKINSLKEEMIAANDFLAFLREAKIALSQHTYSSQMIAFLENYTLDNIYYKSISVNTENNTLNIDAYTEDYKTVAEQLLLFQSLTDIIDEVNISSAQVEDNDKTNTPEFGVEEVEYVQFDISISFKPEFIQKNIESDVDN